ncbi:hypothetical protein A2Z00_03790 [Candidatus Gottesmanbacteria bacterium RBG_13_45_10]|uniref:DUF6922 domain-containing protein n=1 Tax=Candidatus Gottesmanbacteria bacterium RBG_13_45_10 TaxID=1798370 RepID=A0A1F5ZHG4_9BACT|nr:MAG: hypothetical protein A2Z00_03790 [Candidatus Gottesmanbacteria bacterium RBG_13_45_10]
MNHPPTSLQSVLWSANVDTLNIEKDKSYIIHQILSHGTLAHIRWLFQTYPKDTIQTVFQNYPYKDYRAVRFAFVINHLLHLNRDRLDERNYVKNIPRAIG